MIRWNVAKRAKGAGIENANQLARRAGLSTPVAYRVWSGEELERIDVDAVERIAELLDCDWWLLLDRVPDKRR